MLELFYAPGLIFESWWPVAANLFLKKVLLNGNMTYIIIVSILELHGGPATNSDNWYILLIKAQMTDGIWLGFDLILVSFGLANLKIKYQTEKRFAPLSSLSIVPQIFFT